MHATVNRGTKFQRDGARAILPELGLTHTWNAARTSKVTRHRSQGRPFDRSRLTPELDTGAVSYRCRKVRHFLPRSTFGTLTSDKQEGNIFLSYTRMCSEFHRGESVATFLPLTASLKHIVIVRVILLNVRKFGVFDYFRGDRS